MRSAFAPRPGEAPRLAVITPALTVRAAAAGRVRMQLAALRGRPDLAGALEVALAGVDGLRGVQAHPRTGGLVIWVGSSAAKTVDDLVVLVAGFVDDLPQAVEGPPHGVHDRSTDGEIARLLVGGAVLAALAVRKVLLRRPPFLSPPARQGATAIAIFTGYPFFKGAARSLTGSRSLGTDLLVTTATVASLVLRENVVALTVLWLLNVGEYLQEATLRRTRRAIRDLVSLGHGRTWLVMSDGSEVDVPVESVTAGDVVAVYEASVMPVDGVVLEGEAVVDQAAITGENLPVYRTASDPVFAGTVLAQGSLKVRANTVGGATTVGRIIARVEEAQADRAPIERIATQFSRRFVPASFLLAGATWALTGDARRAMTMLLIACPCAAGLSTPTAVSAAIGHGARRGMLIKGGSHLEAAGRVTAVVFDKTGTLTVGRPLVTNVVALADDWNPERVLAYAASSEVHARHPLAQAVVSHTEAQHIEIPLHEGCEALLGLGMRVVVGGSRLLLGSPRLMERYGVEVGDAAAEWITRLERNAETPVCLAFDDRLVGLLGLTDAVRIDAPEVTNALRAIGVERVVMLTGDTPEAATAVAERLGVAEWQARVLPEDKLDAVRELQRQGYVVAVVGDGTNDAPALAIADVGIAMGLTATDVAVETADVALAGNQLAHVVGVIELGRSTLRVVRQNYALAVGINSVGLIAAAFGSLNPVLAAVAHNASSVAVVLNSARLVGEPRPARRR